MLKHNYGMAEWLAEGRARGMRFIGASYTGEAVLWFQFGLGACVGPHEWRVRGY